MASLSRIPIVQYWNDTLFFFFFLDIFSIDTHTRKKGKKKGGWDGGDGVYEGIFLLLLFRRDLTLGNGSLPLLSFLFCILDERVVAVSSPPPPAG